jgi:hypothetical protein
MGFLGWPTRPIKFNNTAKKYFKTMCEWCIVLIIFVSKLSKNFFNEKYSCDYDNMLSKKHIFK